jgi:hypothetical protein
VLVGGADGSAVGVTGAAVGLGLASVGAAVGDAAPTGTSDAALVGAGGAAVAGLVGVAGATGSDAVQAVTAKMTAVRAPMSCRRSMVTLQFSEPSRFQNWASFQTVTGWFSKLSHSARHARR